jgi:CheY-like chemotaxis protein
MGSMMGEGWPHDRYVATEQRPRRVIVADDEPDVLCLVAAALRGFGYEITQACNGAQLLDEIGDALLSGNPTKRPDIIIADIRMPGLTGLEILASVRQAHWRTGVILMTAYADQEIREEAQRLGADAFFAKPFDVDNLMTAVINMTPLPSGSRGD